MIPRFAGAAVTLALVTWLSLGLAHVVVAAPRPNLLPAVAGVPASTAGVIYSQLPSPGGGLYQSSRQGTDYDRYVWDGFVLPSGGAISEIRWRGGFDPTHGGSGGPVDSFTVAIYGSTAAGTQPDVTHSPLVSYTVTGNAGQRPAGVFGGVQMYDYAFGLPSPFQVTAGVPYWVQIEASQSGVPDWGIAAGTGGNNAHYLGLSVAGDISYYMVGGDTAFTLLDAASSPQRIYLPLL